MTRSTQAQSCGSIGSLNSPCHQRYNGRSESSWEKTMLGSSLADGPSSKNESCSEQTCLLPARLTWQWTLIHASTRFSFAPGLAPITIARQAWSSVISEIVLVFRGREPGSSLYTARLISDARVLAAPLSDQSFFS